MASEKSRLLEPTVLISYPVSGCSIQQQPSQPIKQSRDPLSVIEFGTGYFEHLVILIPQMRANLVISFLCFRISMNTFAQTVEVDANAVEPLRRVGIEKVRRGRS